MKYQRSKMKMMKKMKKMKIMKRSKMKRKEEGDTNRETAVAESKHVVAVGGELLGAVGLVVEETVLVVGLSRIIVPQQKQQISQHPRLGQRRVESKPFTNRKKKKKKGTSDEELKKKKKRIETRGGQRGRLRGRIQEGLFVWIHRCERRSASGS